MPTPPRPPQSLSLTLNSSSPAETERLGRRLGRLARPGDVFCLSGPLGAGKTVLARGLARGLAPARASAPAHLVVSPSFTLIHEHPGRLPCYHIDLFRLSPESVGELGLEEYLERQAVLLIEWADRLPPALLDERLDIELRFGEGKRQRRLVFRPVGDRAEHLVRSLKKGLKIALPRN